jgi:excisionase family DNA binding protein
VNDPKYLSKQKAARRLDSSTRTIDRLRAKGQLDWIKVGAGVRIDLASLEAYERRQEGGKQQMATEPERRRPSTPKLEALRAAKAASHRAAGRTVRPTLRGAV